MTDKKEPIVKKIVYAGKQPVPEFPNGSKVTFHYVTKRTLEDGTSIVVDDSHKMGQPMELLLGKQFKLEVWESLVKTMAVGEVSTFHVDKSLVMPYPIVAKTLRDAHRKVGHQHKHCCGFMSLQEGGLGYPDLEQLLKNPEDLEFNFELLSFVPPDSYEKEAWQMDDTEKLESLDALKEKGNRFFSSKEFEKARGKYELALGLIEQLQLKEKPGEEDWKKLDAMKNPFLLNLSQCNLYLQDYYSVIQHCTDVLSRDPDNVKAVFRRGKAYAEVWEVAKAKADFHQALQRDPNLKSLIDKEIAILDSKAKEKNQEEKNIYNKLFQ
nr:EOG090X09NR [Triops cancriformis]